MGFRQLCDDAGTRVPTDDDFGWAMEQMRRWDREVLPELFARTERYRERETKRHEEYDDALYESYMEGMAAKADQNTPITDLSDPRSNN